MNTPIIGIDPGPETSGYVVLWPSGVEIAVDKCENVDLFHRLRAAQFEAWPVVAIEDFITYQPVSADSRETIKWIGVFRFLCHLTRNWTVHEISRSTVKTALCGRASGVTDASVNAALYDLYGGSRKAAVGTRKCPGPLYGVTGHAWAALAVAVVCRQRMEAEQGE